MLSCARKREALTVARRRRGEQMGFGGGAVMPRAKEKASRPLTVESPAK